MNLDFILFTPPKGKYTFMDFWGQVIFVPKFKRSSDKSKIQEIGSLFGSIFNCYTSTKTTEAHLTVDSALLDVKGFYSHVGQQSHEEEATQSSSKQEEQVDKYIPCLYLDSMVRSEYILVYFHASGEDIKLCHKLMNHMRNSYQINVIAMEYPGYSIHKGKPKTEIVNQEAKIVYDFVKDKLGFSQNKIIVMGRSIGTGVTLQLLQSVNPRALALISPFKSVKTLAKQVAGKVGHYLAKEAYNNLENIKSVKCPTFILHGKKDELISFQNSVQLAQTLASLKTKVKTHFPSKMTHSQFDYYTDLSDPLRQFLMQQGIDLYKQGMKGPVIGEQLFQLPQGMKI